MNTLESYKIGDVLLMTTRMRKGTEVRSCQVFDINYRDNGLVTFTGCSHERAPLPTGSGAFDPTELKEDGTSDAQWGIVQIEKVGHREAWKPFCPRPGDPHYDLMC
jgi:hypothetical protein